MGWVVVGLFEGSFGGWVGDGVGGWRVHGVGGGGVGGFRVHGVGGCVVVGCMVGWVVGEFMGWVKRFNFMNTHPPIKHIQSVTLLLYIYSPTDEQL